MAAAANAQADARAKPLSLLVAYVSSEEENYPSAELNRPTPSTTTAPPKRGWQSAKLCDFPQEIGFRFDGEVDLRSLQILAHQSKTPTKVDVYVSTYDGSGEVAPYHQAQFRKLGYLTFNSNEHSKYRNRERKTVQLREKICYLRLVLHKCHMNPLNLYNQVSLIQVLAYGELITPFATRTGTADANAHPHASLPGHSNLPPVRMRNGRPQGHDDPHGAGADDDEDVYSLVPVGANQASPPPPQYGAGRPGNVRQQQQQNYQDDRRAAAAEYQQQQQAAADPSPARGKHVMLAPLPQGQRAPDADNYYHNPRQAEQRSAYQQAPPAAPPPPPPQEDDVYVPAAQPPNVGSMNGLVHYRSNRILHFEAFYVDTSSELTAKKANAVQVEDFDVAKSCKEQLVFLQENAEKIYELETQKIRCIYEEDFEAARRIKQQMDRLCNFTRAGIDAAKHGRLQALRGHPGPQHDQPHSSMPGDDGGAGNAARGAVGGGRGRQQHHQQDYDEHGGSVSQDEPPRQLPPPTNVPSFDEQPVQSKYAQMMAEQAKGRKNNNSKAAAADGDDADEDAEAGEGEEAEEGGRHEHDDEEAEEGEDEEEEAEEEEDAGDDDDDEDVAATPSPAKKKESPAKRGGKGGRVHQATPPPPPAKGHKSRPSKHLAHADGGDDGDDGHPSAPPPAADIDEDTAAVAANRMPAGGFNIETMDDWERDVYFAIQDEAGRDGTEEAPADPLEATEGLTDFHSNFGHYTTACLYSRRWKLRDAAVRVVTQFFGSLFKHAVPVNATNAMLKYFDTKGYGLLDPIQQAFFSSCEFLTRLVDGRLPDVELSAVQVHVQGLLPRLFLRATDTTAKTRDEAITVIFVLANSAIGPEKVAAAALAEPLDQDKRRMSTQNHRTYLSRLLVMQQLLTNHGLSRTVHVDSIMNKLLLLCLNHQNNEVRDLAVVVVGCIDSSKGQEIMKFLPQIRNPATRAVIEERLAYPDGAAGAENENANEASGGNPRPPAATEPHTAKTSKPVRTRSAKRRTA